jgi:hypothetical protein
VKEIGTEVAGAKHPPFIPPVLAPETHPDSPPKKYGFSSRIIQIFSASFSCPYMASQHQQGFFPPKAQYIHIQKTVIFFPAVFALMRLP